MHKKIKSPSISVKIGKITAVAAGTANFSIEIQVQCACSTPLSNRSVVHLIPNFNYFLHHLLSAVSRKVLNNLKSLGL